MAKKSDDTFPLGSEAVAERKPAEASGPATAAVATQPKKATQNSPDIQLLGRIDRMLQKVPLAVRVATVTFLKQSYDARAAAEAQAT